MEAIIYNRSCWICYVDNATIQVELELFLNTAQFGRLSQLEHQFSPFGYTKIWMLSESHLALHTFPEHDAVYIELSSCIEEKACIFWSCLLAWANENNIPIQLSLPRIEKFAS